MASVNLKDLPKGPVPRRTHIGAGASTEDSGQWRGGCGGTIQSIAAGQGEAERQSWRMHQGRLTWGWRGGMTSCRAPNAGILAQQSAAGRGTTIQPSGLSDGKTEAPGSEVGVAVQEQRDRGFPPSRPRAPDAVPLRAREPRVGAPPSIALGLSGVGGGAGDWAGISGLGPERRGQEEHWPPQTRECASHSPPWDQLPHPQNWD